MSEEEKKSLLSTDAKDEGEIKRPEVPVADYSKKNFYDYLGLKSDASMETIKSTYSELAKKYNPMTNPDEISRYQDIYRAGEILSNEVTKEFYDDYGDISITMYEVFQKYLPFVVERRPINYIYSFLFTVCGVLILLFISASIVIAKYANNYSFSWTLTFLPTIISCVVPIICALVCRKRAIDFSNKKEDIIKHANQRTLSVFVKSLLLILFQFGLICYLDNGEKGFLSLYSLPYFAFEAVVFYQKYLQFNKAAEAIKSNKEVDDLDLKKDNYIKYLIGINNTKCEQNKEGKKGACADCAIKYLFLHIFHIDLLRLVQNILIIAAFSLKPQKVGIFFIPTLISFIVSIAEMVIQNKIGYVRSTADSTNSIFWIIMYFGFAVDALFLIGSIDFHIMSITTHVFPFLVEVIFLAGFDLGILPFIPIMEFKLKHDETDSPMF